MSFIVPLMYMQHEEDYNSVMKYLKTHNYASVESACKACRVDIKDFSEDEIIQLKYLSKFAAAPAPAPVVREPKYYKPTFIYDEEDGDEPPTNNLG